MGLPGHRRDGRRFERWADENYRGGPDNPLSDRQRETKFRDCAEGLLSAPAVERLLEQARSVERLADVGVLIRNLDWMDAGPE